MGRFDRSKFSLGGDRDSQKCNLKPGAIPSKFDFKTDKTLHSSISVATTSKTRSGQEFSTEATPYRRRRPGTRRVKKDCASTRIILDATEIAIDKPSNVDAQSITFSSYKNKNTLKVIMVGISPNELVTYVSDAYGGSASDNYGKIRFVFKWKISVNSGDSIMADRGILVQDLFSSLDVKVKTPTMLKGKHQLKAVDVVKDRRIASKRIHVERVIGLAKTYKILKQPFTPSLTPLGGRIIFVCFMLTNFRIGIVEKWMLK
ncbi:LOW QUALITY PROTEIN: uncharacterized protein LOC108950665 [Ciona intestinalis]